MNVNPYATPLSSLEVTEGAPETFYVVSKRKFVLLFLTTQGWYLLYWFYRNWKLYRAATGTQVMPKVRAIFALFFAYALFTRIDRHISASGQRHSWYPRCTAMVFILINLAAVTQPFVRGLDLQVHLQFLLGIVSTLLQTCCLLHVQTAINVGENDPKGWGNSTLTLANAVWMLLGFCLWGVMIAALFLTPGLNPG